MRSLTVGTSSGCLAWLLAFGVALTCLCPIAGAVGGITSTVAADRVATLLEPWLCPDGSRAEIVTHATTIRDENGVDRPATGYEMQCVDAAGTIVRPPSPNYGFLWVALLMGAGTLLAALLAFALAAPVGALVARWAARRGTG